MCCVWQKFRTVCTIDTNVVFLASMSQLGPFIINGLRGGGLICGQAKLGQECCTVVTVRCVLVIR